MHLPNFVPSVEPVSAAPEPRHSHTRGRPYFLFVGRLEKLKGVQRLIPLFRHYQKAELVIAGTGSYESQLKRLAKNCANIRFLGYVSNPQLHALYDKAVAVIVPSLCFESFPQVIIEAFSRQTPALVTNMGGMPEIIEESGGGCIYNTDEELLAATEKLLADRMQTRAGLPSFFRQRITISQAEGAIKRGLDQREAGFLDLIRTRVYGDPTSPYLRLLEIAGCEFPDVCDSIHHGIRRDRWMILRRDQGCA